MTPGITWISDTTLTEAILLGIAFVLSAAIGLERHRKLKSAGLRTHALVGIGSAVFTLVSAYGFAGVTGTTSIVDPSRIAAQIVSGIGFLGAGVIFVRRNAISGLTTAASIWLTAAVGMACGAGAPLLALMATGFHFLSIAILGVLGRRIPTPPTEANLVLRYRDGEGVLRTTLGYAAKMDIEAFVRETVDVTRPGKHPRFQATIRLRESDPHALRSFADRVGAHPGVLWARIDEAD